MPALPNAACSTIRFGQALSRADLPTQVFSSMHLHWNAPTMWIVINIHRSICVNQTWNAFVPASQRIQYGNSLSIASAMRPISVYSSVSD